jgi:hypothetical protein
VGLLCLMATAAALRARLARGRARYEADVRLDSRLRRAHLPGRAARAAMPAALRRWDLLPYLLSGARAENARLSRPIFTGLPTCDPRVLMAKHEGFHRAAGS